MKRIRINYNTTDQPAAVMQMAIDAVLTACRLCSPELNFPDCAQIAALIRGCYTTRRYNGRTVFRLRASVKRSAPIGVRCLHAMIRWNSGNGSMWALYGVRSRIPADAYDRITSLSQLLAVLSGGSRAIAAWDRTGILDTNTNTNTERG